MKGEELLDRMKELIKEARKVGVVDDRERIHRELEFAITVRALTVNNGVLLWDIINDQAEQTLKGEK